MLYIIIVLTLFVNDKNLLCNFEYDDKMDVKNNIMLFIFTATQLFPCYIVPYAFNYRLKETSNKWFYYFIIVMMDWNSQKKGLSHQDFK